MVGGQEGIPNVTSATAYMHIQAVSALADRVNGLIFVCLHVGLLNLCT